MQQDAEMRWTPTGVDVARRMSEDADFRAAVRQDPTTALAGYTLSSAEQTALATVTDDAPNILVGERITKGYKFG